MLKHLDSFGFGLDQIQVNLHPGFAVCILGGDDLQLPPGLIPFPGVGLNLKQQGAAIQISR